jgi:DNA-directed RNA polymerase subunit K/omega
MTDDSDVALDGDTDSDSPVLPVAMPRTPVEPAPLITNRFLFVDVAAQRAKQLRRGALPRLAQLRPDPSTGERPPVTVRLERIAMEEVEGGLIEYDVPPQKAPETEQ